MTWRLACAFLLVTAGYAIAAPAHPPAPVNLTPPHILLCKHPSAPPGHRGCHRVA